MISKLWPRVTALIMGAAISVDQAFAFAWPPSPGSGESGSVGAPELDGSGAFATVAFLVAVALVLFNRSRNR